MASRFINSIVATEDPPPDGVPNPIHATDGADAAGYSGALVAGVRTYGWAADTVTQALGEAWLDSGWIDYSLRRPLFAGELLNIQVERDGDHWSVSCSAGAEKRIVLDGFAGLGEAAWLDELEPPAPAPAKAQPETLPGYDLDHVPFRQPLNPLTVYVSSDAARAMVSQDLGLKTMRYVNEQDTPSFIHPYFLAARMAPLTRHNFVYGPTIHVRSQIQHRREAQADRDITVRAQIVDAYDRNDHWYQVLDGGVTDERGELALIRHHTIFRPRGT
jgi:hypothetical protein